MANNYAKVAQFKTVESFRAYLQEQGIAIGLADPVPAAKSSLAQPLAHRGRMIGNRWAILPMEGWDCTDDGAPIGVVKAKSLMESIPCKTRLR